MNSCFVHECCEKLKNMRPVLIMLISVLLPFTDTRDPITLDTSSFRVPEVEGVKYLILHAGRILAEVYLNHQDHIIFCRLSEAEEAKDAISDKFSENRHVSVQQLSVDNMIEVISKCNSLPTPLDPGTRVSKRPRPRRLMGLAVDDILDALHGIFPGTKWCGLGNTAQSFFDLGKEQEVDRCCRQHDYCPVRMGRFTQKNPTPYTQVHCKCDKIFYDCLKRQGSTLADNIGMIFFNLIKVNCVDLVQPKRCVVKFKKAEGETEQCARWEEDLAAIPELVVVKAPLEY